MSAAPPSARRRPRTRKRPRRTPYEALEEVPSTGCPEETGTAVIRRSAPSGGLLPFAAVFLPLADTRGGPSRRPLGHWAGIGGTNGVCERRYITCFSPGQRAEPLQERAALWRGMFVPKMDPRPILRQTCVSCARDAGTPPAADAPRRRQIVARPPRARGTIQPERAAKRTAKSRNTLRKRCGSNRDAMRHKRKTAGRSVKRNRKTGVIISIMSTSAPEPPRTRRGSRCLRSRSLRTPAGRLSRPSNDACRNSAYGTAT